MRRLLAALCAVASLATLAPAGGAGERAAAAGGERTTSLAVAADLPADAARTIDRLVEDAIRAGDFPGAVVVIASSRRVLYRKAYGARTYEPRRIPNDPSTIYEFASVTKPAV
ncbi:MAG TPA: serine hydrolase, partial [Candidatus Elarobacter sp.]|nr:serine hydrolase [Candidatus Elarobacter sp.]